MTERKRTTTSKTSELAIRHTRRGLPRDTPDAAPRKRKKAKRRTVRQRVASTPPFWRAMAWCVLVIILITVGATVFRSLTRSEMFSVKHIDITGNQRTSKEEMLTALRENSNSGLWQLNLDDIRQKLKKNPWVREVEVKRSLPDRLKVTISEREPWLLVRQESGHVVWVDQDGTILGEQSRFNVSNVPPLVSGLAEGNAPQVADKRQRQLEQMRQLLTALDNTEPRLSPRIDEVMLDDVNGLKLRVNEGRVVVTIGTENYRYRTEEALKVLDAVTRRDVTALRVLKLTDAERLLSGPPIAYINATLSDRVVVGLATQ
ncbi:MAG: FtsQ-type POTRA domain-containing protein [Acidobacteria bacterium]|nr:FtsQ-type POTRA domain-containing protein [Acidobacteriota bacterium]